MTKENQIDYDVIVIGTGMGGSAAGGICALNGLKTLILEKNPRIGGACSYYEKEGFHMDTGTHLFIRGNKGPFGVCTERLGLGKPLKFLHTNPITHIKGFNLDLEVPTGKLEALPFLFKFIHQADIPFKEYPAIIRMFRDIVKMKQRDIEKIDGITIEDFMKKYTSNMQVLSIVGFLMGLYFILPTWEASAGESIWNMQKMAKEVNLGYPKGGCVAIPRTFLEGAEKHGATLKTKTGVKKVDIEDGKIKGVILENGEKISARAVISTTSLKDTILKLAGEEYFQDPYIEKIKRVHPSLTATQAKIAVRKKLVRAGSLVGGWPTKIDLNMTKDQMKEHYDELLKGKVGEFVSIYTPVPTNYDPELAPEGCQILTVVAAAPTLETKLEDPSEVWIEKMMDAMYQLVPGLKENILFYDTWSVETLAGWIGKSNGSAITTGQTTTQVGPNRPPHETPISGLYVAGDGAGPARGVGTELACQSGMDCADLVKRDIDNYIIS